MIRGWISCFLCYLQLVLATTISTSLWSIQSSRKETILFPRPSPGATPILNPTVELVLGVVDAYTSKGTTGTILLPPNPPGPRWSGFSYSCCAIISEFEGACTPSTRTCNIINNLWSYHCITSVFSLVEPELPAKMVLVNKTFRLCFSCVFFGSNLSKSVKLFADYSKVTIDITVLEKIWSKSECPSDHHQILT